MDTDEQVSQQDPDLSQGGSESETTKVETQVGGDDIEALRKELEETKAKNVKLYNRLQENKAKPKADPEPQKVTYSPSEISREELVLLTKGLDEEDVDYLKDLQALAKMKGKEINLKEAQEDDRFKVWKAEKDRKERSKAAQLGAGRGVSQGTQGIKPNQSKDEHRRIWEERLK